MLLAVLFCLSNNIATIVYALLCGIAILRHNVGC